MKTKTKNKIKRMWKKIRKAIYKGICVFFATILCVGCGTTKAVVSKPAAGTSTVITITTNNPITTDVSPDVQLKLTPNTN